ncbi:hypothetical protein ASPVEDRAFT_201469 [Aspergillus versicolor CBS 583.65]|uniref:FAD dependent oxidoreductase domain-containing protein n=1 Tax=Aspergillus versicolor CBS 583.65 TaxID=1036611 RepID=A0A1L9PZR3_ASPVE|nr:uncharacterized protein ASPVEDRAFT_201469 [Aspergillus versicolor CBS 583.65]OJJ07003.1 hypothetical protein ASPVEDRAFT_201469 [Aspergillus versicolor CBS 583.65]
MATDKKSRIVIVGAGVFGLSIAHQLASEGYKDVVVLDRHMPPVPNGSSTDISRVVRFDYADTDYLDIAYEAYQKWSKLPRYKGIYYSGPYILTGNTSSHGQAWIRNTSTALQSRGMPWSKIDSVQDAKKAYPVLSGPLGGDPFNGYMNLQAGWADASKATAQLRDDCLELGVSFICGPRGTVVGLDYTSNNGDRAKSIKAVKTLAGTRVEGDHFVLSVGAWISNLVPMYNSALATGQVLGYVRLTPEEMVKYKDLPIYANASTGWFNFPPHEDTQMLKFAVHGWGYTRALDAKETSILGSKASSSPPLIPPRVRTDYVPVDAEERLRAGLREMLPELGDRAFEKAAMCWYTDTPTGDFIMDSHPDFTNVFIAGGGSGHGFKFLPVLGKYLGLAWNNQLTPHLKNKWRFRTEYEHREDAFWGDGSRGGPQRRELDSREKAKL